VSETDSELASQADYLCVCEHEDRSHYTYIDAEHLGVKLLSYADENLN